MRRADPHPLAPHIHTHLAQFPWLKPSEKHRLRLSDTIPPHSFRAVYTSPPLEREWHLELNTTGTSSWRLRALDLTKSQLPTLQKWGQWSPQPGRGESLNWRKNPHSARARASAQAVSGPLLSARRLVVTHSCSLTLLSVKCGC